MRNFNAAFHQAVKILGLKLCCFAQGLWVTNIAQALNDHLIGLKGFFTLLLCSRAILGVVPSKGLFNHVEDRYTRHLPGGGFDPSRQWLF